MATYLEKKTLYIIRHGETDYNRLNIVQGSGVDTPLNSNGLEQANLFYKAYKNSPFDKIYVSALQRTKQTVQSFIDQGLPVEVIPELNEISWGKFEGKVQTDEQKAVYWDMVNRWNNGDIHASIEGGESPFQLQLRQKRALDYIMSKEGESEILICMHGRAMKSFLCLMLQKSLDKMEEFKHSNLCLYKLVYENETFQMLEENNISHLNMEE